MNTGIGCESSKLAEPRNAGWGCCFRSAAPGELKAHGLPSVAPAVPAPVLLGAFECKVVGNGT
jgi:hypothetical protein